MQYQFVLLPLGIVLLTQFIVKQLIELIRGKFSWKNLLAYGGMPSAHSALVASLATIIGFQEGLNSSSFAISLFFAIIVITDAIGFRGYLTEHSRAINKLIIDLPDELEYKYKTLNERISHTATQVIIGVVTGFVLTYLLLFII